MDDLALLRENWSWNLMVKGIYSASDAVNVLVRGADALMVSNRGGRQLDCAQFRCRFCRRSALPRARCQMILDSGIMSVGDTRPRLPRVSVSH